jgi:hypothetical protein
MSPSEILAYTVAIIIAKKYRHANGPHRPSFTQHSLEDLRCEFTPPQSRIKCWGEAMLTFGFRPLLAHGIGFAVICFHVIADIGQVFAICL